MRSRYGLICALFGNSKLSLCFADRDLWIVRYKWLFVWTWKQSDNGRFWREWEGLVLCPTTMQGCYSLWTMCLLSRPWKVQKVWATIRPITPLFLPPTNFPFSKGRNRFAWILVFLWHINILVHLQSLIANILYNLPIVSATCFAELLKLSKMLHNGVDLKLRLRLVTRSNTTKFIKEIKTGN